MCININEKYAILGLGKTGISVLNYLFANHAQYVIGLDDNYKKEQWQQLQQTYTKLQCYSGQIIKNLAILKTVDTIILSPGINYQQHFIEECQLLGINIISDIDLLMRVVYDKKIIGITGTNGKSTVAWVCYEILKAANKKVVIGGNFGIPAMNLLNQNADIYVLELSSFQIERSKYLKLDIAVNLNIAPDHLDKHGSFYLYSLAKLDIYKQANKKIINLEEDYHSSVIKPFISYGLNKGDYHITANKQNKLYLTSHGKKVIAINKLQHQSSYYLLNMLAVLAICDNLKISYKIIANILSNFKGLDHRCENLGYVNGKLWINDSKGTNVQATQAAITNYAKDKRGNWFLIMGGVKKENDFRSLIDIVKKNIYQIVCYGQAAKCIYENFKNVTRCIQVETLNEAVAFCERIASNQDGILFSPACASFDQFDNFEHRGQIFKKLVKQLE